jgi:hypothetical protein
MTTTRRRFIEAAAANAAAFAILPGAAFASVPPDMAIAPSTEEWNVGWADRLNGKHKAVFDIAEVESGYGVWRGALWANQYTDVMKAAPADLSPILVLRHNAIILAMQQPFWDRYNIGELKQVKHPLTEEPTKKNPVLLDERDNIPAPFNTLALHKQIARGATVLACNLALQDCVRLIAKMDKVAPDVARQRAIAYLVPGVILQPSGVFGVIRAQQAGAAYIKAS